MTFDDCLDAAFDGLDKAEQLVRTGEDPEAIFDLCTGSLTWGMEAWLTSSGYRIVDRQTSRQTFSQHGGILFERTTRLRGKLARLDDQRRRGTLRNGGGSPLPLLPMHMWWQEAARAIDEARDIVNRIARGGARLSGRRRVLDPVPARR